MDYILGLTKLAEGTCHRTRADHSVIVGERTPGRALVVDSAELPIGAVLIYPVRQTTTAGGTVLEGHGVVRDIPVWLQRDLLLRGVDSQLDAAIEYIESVSE